MAARPRPDPHPNDPACDAIWQEYADATSAHVNLQLDLYMAVASKDRDREEQLSELVLQAESRRQAAREAIRRSEIH